MVFYLLFYFIPVTLLFLAMAVICFFYVLMGIRQLATGYREKNTIKTRSGLITFIIAAPLLVLLVYGYCYFLITL
jgi:hypothetical protein